MSTSFNSPPSLPSATSDEGPSSPNLFHHYEDEFITLSRGIEENLSKMEEDSSFTASLLTVTKSDMQSANQMLDQMDLEVMALPSSPTSFSSSDKHQLIHLREDFESFKERLGKIITATTTTTQSKPTKPKTPSLRNNERDSLLSLPLDSLDRSNKMAIEAEQIGSTVLEDLRRQREQIERAGRYLHETDNDVDLSNRILRDIIRKMVANRMTTTIVFILLISAILLLTYHKLFH